MAIEVFNRHEQKYLLDADTFQKVLKVMDEHMMPDKYNVNHKPYTISNIYFDTEDDYLIRTSLSKPKYKEKLRLRSYGVPNNDCNVFLEIKKKFNDIVNKRRTVLKLSEAYNFISSGKPPELKEYMNKQVLKEIEYFLQVYNVNPKVYLAYDRIAYFEKGNDDLRISFDKNIRTRRYDVALEDGGHAIKASDNLTIENGILNLISESDGIHANDTFKMTGGTINASVVGDGVDSESIVIIEGGELNIETNATPIETNTSDILDNSFPMRPEENKTDVEFEKSSKGINAEWMIEILRGVITVNSASHAIHCQDEIEITGGTFSLNSTYDKGISAHGNLTIDGEDTVIDITKSTEGLESKNILTINNGIIDIVSSDDAINATGGKTGSMMGGGGRGEMTPSQNGGERPEFNGFDKVNKGEKNPNGDMMMPNTNRGNRPIPGENGDIQPPEFQNGENRPQNGVMMGGNMKDCLVINGGNIEAVAGDDCLDSNGNIVLNGGTIKAVKENGTFTGANSVIDPDGTLTVGENVTLVLVSRGGTDRGGRNGNSGGLSLPNNAIYLYSETSHNANESITLKNSSGEILAEYLPKAVYSAVLITSPDIEIGEEYVLSVGSETHNVTISEQNTNIGTQPTSQGFGDRPQRMPVLN